MEFINSYRIVVHDYLLKGNYQQRKLLLVGSGDDTLGILLGPLRLLLVALESKTLQIVKITVLLVSIVARNRI